METLPGAAEAKPARRSWRFWLLVLSPILTLGTCTVLIANAWRAIKPAQEQAAIFHRQLNAGEYKEIYRTASPEFHSAVTFPAFAEYLRKIHDQMGSCSQSANQGAPTANSTTSGTTVQLKYSMVCSSGRLDENIAYVIMDGVPRLLRYEASSPFE
jgi:hypothetical protein